MKKPTVLTMVSTLMIVLLLLTAMAPYTAASGGPNLALNKPVSASSAQADYPASNAVDGDAATYWRTAFKSSLSEEWIEVDLGGVFSIDQVVLNWNSYYAISYTVQVSEDDSNWATVYSTTAGDGGVDTIDFSPASARYVMLHSTAWSQKFNHCWLNEFEVYGAGGEPTPTHTPEPGPKKWTFMVYIVGDNDLEPYVTKDIETELGYSNADINVVAIADRHPAYDNSAGDWTTTKLFYITPGMTATPENALADLGEKNMGDPQTLIDFVQWARANYPADRYALILWNHGWAWRPYQSMWDETDDDTMDPHELEAAMNVLGAVDVIGYDACEGMAVENLALWRGHAQAIAGSQEDMGYVGFEYEQVLPALQANPYMTNEQLAIELAQSEQDWTNSAATLNANWDALMTAIDEWAVALLNGLPTYRSAYDAAYKVTQGVADPLNKDLYDAAQEIKAQVSDPTIQARCQAVMDAHNAVVLYEWHKPNYKGAYGIGIFWPKNPEDLNEPSSPQWNDFDYYRNYLEFSQLTHWDEFLDAYVNQ
jgi:hypothetical protein